MDSRRQHTLVWISLSVSFRFSFSPFYPQRDGKKIFRKYFGNNVGRIDVVVFSERSACGKGKIYHSVLESPACFVCSSPGFTRTALRHSQRSLGRLECFSLSSYFDPFELLCQVDCTYTKGNF